MAATLQQPQSTQTATSNPQLKSLVYSKYRDFLGSYNDRANSLLQTIPSYMVHEDKGFNFSNDDEYGPPPPPPLVAGNVPSRRIQTQLPPEAPACVQNAMMTKDKKPFTYTPGGIDLSQIRSPRMAQRISRNACMEGVTNTPKPSINAQYNNEPQIKTTPPTPPIAASALGMPVQVFPTGPPPPPPPPKNQLAPQPPTQNGSGKSSPERRSPSQSFEPPPIGFRPEIKIPSNPMATLKKAPKPQPKDEFWKEEYIRDRSKSPMSSNTSPQNGVNEEVKPHSPPVSKSNESRIQQQQQQQLKNDREEMEQSPQMYMNRVTSPPNSTSSPTAAILPRPLSPIRLQDNAQQQQQIEQQRQEQIRREQERQEQIRQRQEQILREQQKQREEFIKQEQQRQEQLRRQQEQPRQEFQSQEEYEQDYQKRLAAHRREQARLAELERQEDGKSQQHEQQRREQLQKQEQQRQEQMKLQDRRLQQQQQQLQQPPPAPPINEQQRLQFLNQRWGVPVKEKSPETEPQTQSPPPRNNALGSLYIPPVAPENLSPILQQQQQQQSIPSPQQQQWQTRPREDQEQLINQTTPIWMAPKQQMVQPEWAARDEANRANMNGPREHIIPIQLEHTPTKTPSTPGFGPQPYYNAHQQYSSVPPPMPSYMTQGGYQQPNPNQFVNQYSNVSFPPPRVTSPPVNQSPSYQNGGGRVLAPVIQYENGNGYRGPISQSPTVIQNDPRSLQHQNSWGPNNSGPNQSKSFRILQKITDTLTDNNDTDSEVDSGPGELQKPHYARPLGPQDMNEAQLRKLQLNDRVKSQVVTVARPTARYGSVQTKFQQNDDQPQQPYIHPSEQQVPEPKKYMGSAIPSRSFRILQAMTTPENAANENNLNSDNESDNSVHSNNSSSSLSEMQRYQNNPYMPPPYDPNMPPTYDPYNPYWAYYNPNNYAYMPPMYYGYPPPPPHMMYNPYYGQQIAPTPPPYLENYHNSPVSSGKITTSSSSEELAALTRSNTTSLSTPRIVVTPTPEDQTSQQLDELKQYTAKNSDFFSLSDSLEKVNSTFTLLSKKLSEFSAHIDSPVEGKSLSNDDSSTTKNPVRKDDSLMEIDELSDDSESEESDTEVDEKTKRTSKSSIQSMHSVSNINVYKEDDNDEDDNESVITETDGEEREDDDTDVEEDVEEEEEPEEEPDERERRYYADEIIPHQLSVIFEESEICGFPKSPVFSRRHSNASTVSDCSTTIGNDGDLENYPNKNIDDEPSVTVSFKLFSPSRSLHETTSDLSKIPNGTPDFIKSNSDNKVSIHAKDSSYSSLHESNSDQEVSVTVTIPSRGNSIDRKSKSPSVDVKSSKTSHADDDSEISVSISLPLKSKSKSKSKNQSKSKGDNIQAAKKNQFDTETEYETEYEIEEIYEEIIEYDKWPEDVESDKGKWEYEKVFDKSKTPSRSRFDESVQLVEDEDSDTEKEFDSDDNDDYEYKPKEIKAKPSSNELSSSNDSKSLNKMDEIKLSPSPLNILNCKNEIRKESVVEKVECNPRSIEEDEDEMKLKPLPNKIFVVKLPEIKINLNTSSTPTKEIEKISYAEPVTPIVPSKVEKYEEEIDIWGDNSEEELDWKTKWEMKREKSNSEIDSRSDYSELKIESKEPVWVPFENDDLEFVVSSTLKQFARPSTPKEIVEEPIKETINESVNETSCELVWPSSPKTESVLNTKESEQTSSLYSEPYKSKTSFNPVRSPSSKVEPTVETLSTKYREHNSPTLNHARSPSPKVESTVETLSTKYREHNSPTLNHARSPSPKVESTVETLSTKYREHNSPTLNHARSPSPKVESTFETLSTKYREHNSPSNLEYYSPKASLDFKRLSAPKIEEPIKILQSDSESEYETGEEDLKDDTEVAENSIEMEINKSENSDKPMFKPFNIKSVLGNSSSSSETSVAPRSYNKTPVPFGEYKAKLSQNSTPKISSPLTILEPDKKEPFSWLDQIEEPKLKPEPEPEYFTPFNPVEPDKKECLSWIDQIKEAKPENIYNSTDDLKNFTKSETKPIENYLISDNLFQNREINSPTVNEKRNKTSDILAETTQINNKEIKINVRNRIAVFEKPSSPVTTIEHKPVANNTTKKTTSDSEITSCPRSPLSRHNSSQRSSQEESEADEEDSGVTSDMSRHISEAETESSECFPELKKMSRYQRAATHSRLFKLLQEECGDETSEQEKPVVEEQLQSVLISRPKKIVHNVSITRKQNPNALKEAETMSERRERLCLPLNQSGSIDCDSISSSGSSPTGNVVSDKLVNELVQSLLLKKKGRYLRHLPIEKLHEYAKRVLLEDLESNSIHDTFSSTEDVIPTVDSTPALTPQEFKNSYSEYYDSWDSTSDQTKQTFDILPSKAFKNLQDQQTGLRKQWSVRCPRVLSSKSVNKDLGRVTEIRESESPDPIRSSSPSYKTYNMSEANSIVNNDRQIR